MAAKPASTKLLTRTASERAPVVQRLVTAKQHAEVIDGLVIYHSILMGFQKVNRVQLPNRVPRKCRVLLSIRYRPNYWYCHQTTGWDACGTRLAICDRDGQALNSIEPQDGLCLCPRLRFSPNPSSCFVDPGSGSLLLLFMRFCSFGNYVTRHYR